MITARIPAFLTLASMPVALLLLAALPLPGAQAIKDPTLTGNTTLSGNVTSNATVNLSAASVTLPASITLTSPTATSITAPASTNLTLSGGSGGARLVLGHGAPARSELSFPTYHTAAGYAFRNYDGGGVNDVLAFGYNVGPGGGRIVTTEMQLYQGFESSYLNGGLAQQTMEWYIRFVEENGSSMHEPFFAGFNRSTARTFLTAVRGDQLQFEDSTGATPYFVLSGSLATLNLPLTISGNGITATGASSTFAGLSATNLGLSNTSEATGAALTGSFTTLGGIWAAKNIVSAGTHYRAKSANGSGAGTEDMVTGWINTNGTSGTAGLYAVNTLLDNSSVWLRVKTISAAGTTQQIADFSPGGNLLVGGSTDISGGGGLKVFGSTAATSTTSGALQVVGGAGIGGAVFAGGNMTTGAALRSTSSSSGYLELTEQASAPAAPSANGVRLYIRDNGSGKTVLFARFASGAEQQLAIEP